MTSAARTLTDADVQAIVDALEHRGLVARSRRAAADSANEAPLSQAERDAIDRKVRARMKQLRQRSGRA